MSKKNLSLEKVLEKVCPRFEKGDIIRFCTSEEVSQRLRFAIENNTNISRILVEGKEFIDVERLLLNSYIRLKEDIQEFQYILKEDLTQLERKIAEKNLMDSKKDLQIVSQLAKGMDTYIITLIEDTETNVINSIKVISSKEIIDKVNLSNKERNNRKIYDALNSMYKEEDPQLVGFDYIIQCLNVEDLEGVLPKEFRDPVGYRIERNAYTTCARELELIRNKEEKDEVDDDEYMETYKYVREHCIIPEMRKSIEDILKYIDIQKILLLSIYKYEQISDIGKQEGEAISKEELEFIKRISGNLLEYIKQDTVIKIDDRVYSCEDVKDFISRINEEEGKYATKDEIDEIRYLVLNGYDLGKLNPEDTYKLGMLKLTDNEVRKVMKTSKDNLAFGVMKLNPPEKEIIKIAKENKGNWSEELTNYLLGYEMISTSSLLELAYNDVVSLEFLKMFSEGNDISSEINLSKINEQYLLVKGQKEPKQEDSCKLDKMIELYKLVNIEEKKQEELEELSDSVMYEIAENFEGEEDILFYYEKGLVTLRTVAEWSGESTIERLYNEEKITFEDIENANIGIDIKQAVLGKHIMANVETYSQDELLEYINKGYLSEQNIYDIYKIALLNETYAEDMLYNGIISAPTYTQITNIGKEVLEEQADTRFSNLLAMGLRNFSLNLMEDEMEESNIAIGDVPVSKKQNEQLDEEGKGKNSKYPISTKSTESLIDPNIRWEFLKALKCKLPKDKEINNQDPNNPFYNYEFYVIESDNDEAEKDSIVIAERFFKDKFQEDEYATSNATYIWQYKDYLIAQRMLKSEQKKNKKAVLQETEGVVYVANHRPGSWAVSLLYKIAQAKAGKSFDDCKRTDKGATKVLEQLEKLYTQEELIKILDLAKIIDDDQKVMMPNGKEAGLVYDVIKEDRRIEARKEDNHGEGER